MASDHYEHRVALAEAYATEYCHVRNFKKDDVEVLWSAVRAGYIQALADRDEGKFATVGEPDITTEVEFQSLTHMGREYIFPLNLLNDGLLERMKKIQGMRVAMSLKVLGHT